MNDAILGEEDDVNVDMNSLLTIEEIEAKITQLKWIRREAYL